MSLEKPLIAALNGFAVGVGLNMALQCQLRVMAEDAWIGDQHTNVGRLGAPHEMYQALPRTAAAYLSLCNGRLSAQECLQLGIVNRVDAAGRRCWRAPSRWRRWSARGLRSPPRRLSACIG